MNNKVEILQFIINKLGELTGGNELDLDLDMDFDSFGLSSVNAVMLLGELEEFIDMDLSPSILFEYDTVNKLVDHIDNILKSN